VAAGTTWLLKHFVHIDSDSTCKPMLTHLFSVPSLRSVSPQTKGLPKWPTLPHQKRMRIPTRTTHLHAFLNVLCFHLFYAFFFLVLIIVPAQLDSGSDMYLNIIIDTLTFSKLHRFGGFANTNPRNCQ
jgi:hypothetical protein